MTTKPVQPEDLNALPLEELYSQIINAKAVDSLILLAMGEDLAARGDVTSRLMVGPDAVGSGAFVSRAKGVLSGGVLLDVIARHYDPRLRIAVQVADGGDLSPGDNFAQITGPLRSILAAERVMLNFLTHLSGIATLTAKYVEAITGEKARIFDTRKTVPGLRRLAKYAVRCGGGNCHRIGLHDAVLIKDNHLAGVGHGDLKATLDRAIAEARVGESPPAFVEVEVDTLDQLRVVLGCDVDVVLLDNMTPQRLREAVAIRDDLHPSVQLEASGGVSLHNIDAIAAAGVDRIAVGAITHSAPALDIGLDIAAP